jgi:hypothetical protein
VRTCKPLLFDASNKVFVSTFHWFQSFDTITFEAGTNFPSLTIATAIPGTLKAVKVFCLLHQLGSVICANENVTLIKAVTIKYSFS